MSKTDSQKPDFSLEQTALNAGARFVAGVDEAGRGPLAGPVVVAAVVLDQNAIPDGLNDSKKLTAKRRDALFDQIMSSARVAIATAPPAIIDDLNIRGATLWAMRQAVLSLSPFPHHVLVDGRDIPPGLPAHAQAVIGGDSKSVSIAAASIVAKVVRDRMCPVMDADQTGFGFAQHKGYGTAVHMAALEKLGPSPHHRQSFAPVAKSRRAS